MAESNVLGMPAWWDPKNRTLIFNGSTIVCGALVVTADSIAFVSERRAELAARLDEVSVKWLTARAGVDLTTSVGAFRIYLTLPNRQAPRLRKGSGLVLAEHLEAIGAHGPALGQVSDDLADFAEFAGLIGDLLALGSAISGLYRGYRNISTLKARLSGRVTVSE